MATKIMVVDDEMLICQLLTYQLSGVGYEVTSAQQGQEALRRLMLEQPALVMLDVMIGDMSGWEVCRHIRANSNVPIIMLTAKGSEGDIVMGLKAGADDYITKPFSLPQLLARVEAVLRRARVTRVDPPVANTPDLPEERIEAPHLQYAATFYAETSNGTASEGMGGPTAEVSVAAPPASLEAAPPAALTSAQPLQQPLGQRLLEARRLRGWTLHQAERISGVRWDFLQALEQEHFGYMPRAQLRHALRTYTATLGLDLHELVGRPEPRTQRRWPIPLTMVAVMTLVLVLLLGLQFF